MAGWRNAYARGYGRGLMYVPEAGGGAYCLRLRQWVGLNVCARGGGWSLLRLRQWVGPNAQALSYGRGLENMSEGWAGLRLYASGSYHFQHQMALFQI